jgi:hypothetical protein
MMAWSRGKKGKLKKMKEKYKDQDEEERQLKMQILQVTYSPNLLLQLFQCCGSGMFIPGPRS